MANLFGDKSARMLLPGSGGKKGKKSSSISGTKGDFTHCGDKVVL